MILLAATLLAVHASPPSPGPVAAEAPDPASAPADTVLDSARSLLARGLSLPAARLLARALSRGDVSGPGAVLLAARAHGSHGDWETVRRLLIGQPWLGEEGSAEGRRLLARAHLELGDAAAAAGEYARYFADREAPPAGGGTEDEGAASAPAGETGGHDLQARVSRARALAAAGRPAESAAVLLRAADLAPAMAPWLRLSALRALVEAGPGGAPEGRGATASRSPADSGRAAEPTPADGEPQTRPDPARLAAALLEEPVLPADSIRALAARWAFSRGDPAEGVRLARRAGHAARGLAGSHVGPALLAAGDTAGAATAFRAALGGRRPDSGLAPALLALDSTWEAFGEAAASDLRSDRRERGMRFLREALERAPAGERAPLAERLGAALRAAGQPGRALEAIGPWLERPDPDPERSARLWLLAAGVQDDLGRPADAAAALATAAAGEGDEAALAAYLLADRRHDEGDLDAARAAYAESHRRFPSTRYGERSLVRLGLLDVLQGRPAAAEGRFREYRRRYGDGEWAVGALYWMGRTALAGGDSALAERRFRRVLEADPLGYYGLLAGRRLHADPWDVLDLEGEERETKALRPEHRELLRRMGRLRDVGWPERARAEFRHSGPDGGVDARYLVTLALALDSAGWSWEGVAAGWRARDRSRGWSRALLRAIYPLPYRAALLRSARERGLSPALVAGLARRESLFDPAVVSSAGAVGLMQLLPSTALDVAARAGLPGLQTRQLTHPEVNLLLGTRYLADLLEDFGGSRTAALISYNAGPHRYRAWRGFPERAFDPELFVERIPFRETREYVRAVSALASIYSRLHGLSDPGAGGPRAAGHPTVDASGEGG